MREPAWNKRISICSLSHAAILNVWSSHCPLAISPRQRRTRNHQPVPTFSTRKDDAGAGIMLQSSMRSAALLVLAAGMAATSATAKPPGAPPAAHPAPAPHPAAPRRRGSLPLAPRRTSPRRVWRRRHRAQQRPGSPPRRGRRHQHTASRRSNSRVLPARPHRPPAQGRQDMGRRNGRSSLRRQRNGVGGRGGPGLAQPALRERPGRQPQESAQPPAAQPPAASARIAPGQRQIRPAGPGIATGNLQPNRCRPHLAQ